MLIILALVFLFADIVLGNFDIIPDCVGFLLLFFFMLLALKKREVKPLWPIVGLAALLLSIAELFPGATPYLLIPAWLGVVILPFFLARKAFSVCLERAMVRPVAPSAAEREASTNLVTAGLLLIVLCELSAPLLGIFWNLSRYLLLGLKSLAGLFVILCFIRIIYKKQY